MKCPRCKGSGEVQDPGTLAQRLVMLRETRGLSRKDVEEQVPIIHSKYWRLESGTTENPEVEVLVKLANFYEVTIDYLVGRAST